ncbi:hypothetical protein ACFSM7_13105 [Clavibacter michiganensis subsp. tessellarius]|uniref:hypothetical protein n=1 Tax=Clavibacter tessellarius TaxID=31965 RepID=UPI00364509EE
MRQPDEGARARPADALTRAPAGRRPGVGLAAGIGRARTRGPALWRRAPRGGAGGSCAVPDRTDGDVSPLGRRGDDQRSGMLPANRAVACSVVTSFDWTTW